MVPSRCLEKLGEDDLRGGVDTLLVTDGRADGESARWRGSNCACALRGRLGEKDTACNASESLGRKDGD